MDEVGIVSSDNRKAVLLFLVWGFEQGGVARAFCSLAVELESRGYEIKVMVPAGRRHLVMAIPSRYVVGEFPRVGGRDGWRGRLWIMGNVLTKFRPYFSSFSIPYYDCLVCYHGRTMHWAWHNKKPTVYCFHEVYGGSQDGGLLSRLLKRCLRQALCAADRIIAVSHQSAASQERGWKLPANKIGIYNNLIDVDRIVNDSMLPVSDCYEDAVPKLLYVGRLSHQKGVDRLVASALKLHDEGYEFHLMVIGEGELMSSLKSSVSRCTGDRYIHIMGGMENPYPYMKWADVLVLPSREEGFGLVLIESILCGTPVIATDCGGVRDALKNGAYGEIVKNTDDGLLKGLRRFLSNPDRRLGAKDIMAAAREIKMEDSKNRARIVGMFDSLLPLK